LADRQPDDVSLLGLGASSAVGRDIASTAAAVRAGLSGFSSHRFVLDTAGQPVRVASAPWLETGLPVLQRLEALLQPAIDEALSSADVSRMRVALSLAVPSYRPGLPRDIRDWYRTAIASRRERPFSSLACFDGGQASSFAALEAAANVLCRGLVDAVVVAGVDSLVVPQTLDWLEANDQLHGAGRLNNAWGFVPGEAAAALLLARGETADRLGSPRLGRVRAVANAMESCRIKTPTVCLGQGLSEALRRSLETLPQGRRVSDIYNDLNGEPYRADEYGFAIARHSELFDDPSAMVTASDCTGDIGAASGALHIALACMAAAKGYAAGDLAMVHGSSEGGERGAALIDFSR
jgi:3-oxoacyl-[acyl-carrier-protein] synthase-1